MSIHGAVRTSANLARRLPWLTHLLASAGLFTWILWTQIHEYGLTSTESYPIGLMDVRILIAAWLIVLPAVVLEVAAAATGRLWFARGAACAATAVLAWFGTLPVWLRFFGSRDPVSHADVRSAVLNYMILLTGYAVLLLGALLLRRSGRPVRPRVGGEIRD